MATHRSLAAFARYLTALVALGSAVLLGGCGGGSGAPNNAFAPPPAAFEILPGTATLYASSPTLFTVSGGSSPFSVFSSDTAVLPVPQAASERTLLAIPTNVSADTNVTLTVRDSQGRAATAAVVVRPAPLINGLVISADKSPTTCGGTGSTGTGDGTTVVCSGDTGTVTARLAGPGNTTLAGRQVRFEVVQGNFTFFSGATQAASVIATTDQNGTALARFQAAVNAPSAFALVRATDLATGNQVTGTFTIAQITDGSNTLRVIPDTATITGAFKGVCSSGFATDYYIFGGTPPYQVVSTFPTAVTLSGVPVPANGAAFRATTTGVCVDPLNIAITDATGRTTSVTLINKEGTNEPPAPTPPAALVLSPTTLLQCPGIVTIIGGTAPYNVRSSSPTITVKEGATGTASTSITVNGTPATVTVEKTGAGLQAATITVVDSGTGTNLKSASLQVVCQ